MSAPAPAHRIAATTRISRKLRWNPGRWALTPETPMWIPFCPLSGFIDDSVTALDHDIQAQGHHDVGERGDGVVDEAARLRVEERQDRPREQEHRRQDQVAVATDDGSLEGRKRLAYAGAAHPASLVSSPSRPLGRKTMI